MGFEMSSDVSLLVSGLDEKRDCGDDDGGCLLDVYSMTSSNE